MGERVFTGDTIQIKEEKYQVRIFNALSWGALALCETKCKNKSTGTEGRAHQQIRLAQAKQQFIFGGSCPEFMGTGDCL